MNYYINKYKHNTANKLRKMQSNNPKKYWRLLRKNKKSKENKSVTPSIEDFYKHFQTVNSNSEGINESTQNLGFDQGDLHVTSLNEPISADEILKCISNLKNSKASSSTDNILNEYIKSTKDKLLPVNIFLFNSILDTGYMPESWLKGSINPIYKGKGQPSDPNNYRPITILSCLGKLFIAILNLRITKFMNL